MNQPLRALDWKATFDPDERGAESDASKDLFNAGRTESEFVAALAKNWSKRKSGERFRNLNFSEVENRIAGKKQHTDASAGQAATPFSSPRIGISVLTRPRATFVPLQEWEGYVVALTASNVVANLVDLTTGGERPSEQAEIPLEEFSEDDVKKLSAGRVFRWAIGYQRLPSGTKMRVSQFVVRDLPQWTRRELSEAKKEAAELADFFSRHE
jgi:hypothetical protein